MMKHMTHKQKFCLLIVFSILSFALVAAGAPEKPTCPDVIQQGAVVISIPEHETSALMEVQITPCAGMNIQASGGPNGRGGEAVVINAIVHQDVLLLMAHRLEPAAESLEVAVWWAMR